MKLIIDIPDGDYRYIKDIQSLIIARGTCKTIQKDVIDAIKNGILIGNTFEKEQSTDYWSCIEDDNYAGGGYWKCPSCAYRFSFQGFNLLNDMPYCPRCGNRVKTEMEAENDQ